MPALSLLVNNKGEIKKKYHNSSLQGYLYTKTQEMDVRNFIITRGGAFFFNNLHN